jgi:two-component system nitrogen regulation response regulator GlnG
MSVAAMSCESMRPVLPLVREDAAHRAETVGCRAGALGGPPHHPASAPAHLLLLDDDPAGLAEPLRRAFPPPGYRVQVAGSGPGGLHVGTHPPDVVVLDLGRSEPSGLETYRQIRRLDARVPVIFVNGAKRADAAIEAMKQGAYDFLFKPVDLPELRRVVGEALEVSRRMREPAVIAEAPPAEDRGDAIIGRCPAMLEVYKAIGRVAAQDVPVLITGESGTGKELVARAIYQHGLRAKAPFLALNCAAIPESLLESELFGHEKGAFTGAERRRIGKFEQCSDGTLFLDEIGDMPMAAQAKVLRLLQEQAFERLGGNETVRTDVRIIAATHRDLKAWSEQGKFRPDLYYRLGVFTIELPPLRQRGEDLPMLVQHYIRRFNRELGREVRAVAPEALELLRGYPWPGNIRELQSVLKRALLRATGPVLIPAFLPALLGGGRAAAAAGVPGDELAALESFIRQQLEAGGTGLYEETLRRVEQLLLPLVLESTGGNKAQAARILGMTRVTLRTKLRELGWSETRSVEGDDNDPVRVPA